MQKPIFAAMLLLSFSCFAADQKDPYPGSGGLFLGTPSQEDIASGRAVYKPERFATFVLGATTKSQVVEALGVPAGWSREPNMTSMLEYDYVDAEGMMGMRRVRAIFLHFDKKMVLTKIDLPDAEGG